MAVLLENQLLHQNKQKTPSPQPGLDNSTPASAANGESLWAKLRDFFTTPSQGRAVFIGVCIGLLVVAAVLVGVFTSGIAPTIFATAAAAGLSATATGLSMAAISVGIVSLFASISAAIYAISEKIRETFHYESKSPDYKENLDAHDSQDISSFNKSTESMIKMGLVPDPDIKSENGMQMAGHEQLQSDLPSTDIPDTTIPSDNPDDADHSFK